MSEADPFVPLSFDQQNDLRLRIVRGEEPTVQEMQALIQTLSAQRASVLAPKAKAPSKAKATNEAAEKVKVSLDNLLV